MAALAGAGAGAGSAGVRGPCRMLRPAWRGGRWWRGFGAAAGARSQRCRVPQAWPPPRGAGVAFAAVTARIITPPRKEKPPGQGCVRSLPRMQEAGARNDASERRRARFRRVPGCAAGGGSPGTACRHPPGIPAQRGPAAMLGASHAQAGGLRGAERRHAPRAASACRRGAQGSNGKTQETCAMARCPGGHGQVLGGPTGAAMGTGE